MLVELFAAHCCKGYLSATGMTTMLAFHLGKGKRKHSELTVFILSGSLFAWL